MSDNKRPPLNEGYQPIKKGYQPKPQKSKLPGENVTGGYQPTTSEAKPNPPPKKP